MGKSGFVAGSVNHPLPARTRPVPVLTVRWEAKTGSTGMETVPSKANVTAVASRNGDEGREEGDPVSFPFSSDISSLNSAIYRGRPFIYCFHSDQPHKRTGLCIEISQIFLLVRS
ncbi:hypothetical protein FRC14_005392 [Serendipita sp. 396]|nr:hypothetical protein FRC14_005392 [Serendipita sp. 396]KAG8779930.1 hypothetical protein FRC15_009846 [Serendipita sp. 397]KAG8797836.1 hypothetical protein FRC16_008495 [Serendipita sp. 398]KAG8821614.1 hypothetical protein FRC19_007542 [Serendipita sp. 401]KAG8865536.1 hypothetical protein FRC20_009713 [Serendipita sp. 405]KAG9053245.1 hypothetical protein FS842_008464 [Serendipita sp. 407]